MSDHRNQQLNELAKQYAEKATLLSNRIKEFDDYLETIDAKIAVIEKVGKHIFGINRHANGWGLLYLDEQDDWKRVRDASVDVKMNAAKAAPLLLEQMVNRQIQAVRKLDIALSEFDKTFTGKEG